MMCLHCDSELEFNSQAAESFSFYHCLECDKWYELRKEKERVNGAVPVRVIEHDNRPHL